MGDVSAVYPRHHMGVRKTTYETEVERMTKPFELDISPHFVRSVREETTEDYRGKSSTQTLITIKGEYLRDDYYDGEDEEFEWLELMEQEGQLFCVDWNHQAWLTLSDEVVLQHIDALRNLIDEGDLERDTDDDCEEGEEWRLILGQMNPITKGKEDGYNISEEGLLTYYNVPQVVWEHIKGSWCNG